MDAEVPTHGSADDTVFGSGMVRAAMPAADSLMVRWNAAAPGFDPGNFVDGAALQDLTPPPRTQPQVAGGVK